MSVASPNRAATLEALRRRLRTLEPQEPAFGTEEAGLAGLRAAPGELIELRPRAYFDTPAAFSFLAALASAAAKESCGPVLWCRKSGDPAGDFGQLHPHGLTRFGLAAERVILATAADSAGVLWAMEEGAQARGLAVVLGEPGQGPAYGLTASRRLKLAAKESGAALFVLRAFDAAEPTAARRRWGVAASPASPRSWRGAAGLPALGAPRWVVMEERGRAQDGAAREVEWDEQALRFREPQPLADRPARPRNAEDERKFG